MYRKFGCVNEVNLKKKKLGLACNGNIYGFTPPSREGWRKDCNLRYPRDIFAAVLSERFS